MKMAKASEADLQKAMELVQACEELSTRHGARMPAAIAKPPQGKSRDPDEGEPFDIDCPEQSRRALEHLIELGSHSGLFRVVFGCAVLLDPRNRCVDPTADTIEHHPDAEAGLRARQARPAAEWTPEDGTALWWRLPGDTAPYLGKPGDHGWPGDRTHWTAIIRPSAEATSTEQEQLTTSA